VQKTPHLARVQESEVKTQVIIAKGFKKLQRQCSHQKGTIALFFRSPYSKQLWDDFFSNNQKDALIIPILVSYKTLHVSAIFSAHHQEFSTLPSALVSFMQVSMTVSKQSQDGTAFPFWLCLKTVIRTSMKLTSAEGRVENSWWWAEKMPETCRVL
jgi:hypothetical protein